MLNFKRNFIFGLIICLVVVSLTSCMQQRNYRRNDYISNSAYTQDRLQSENTQSNYQQAYQDIQKDSLGFVNSTDNASQGGEISGSNLSINHNFPWKLWEDYRTLTGQIIVNPVIEKGDNLSKDGDFKSALEVYQRATIESLSPDEKNALIARMASSQLSLDDAKGALETISNYISSGGGQATNIDTNFALILAFAYGRVYNFDQSLAWFNNVIQKEGEKPAAKVAENGISMLLMSVSDVELEFLMGKWSSDNNISSLINSEKQFRVSRGKKKIAHDVNPFWAFQNNESGDEAGNPNIAYTGDKKIIAVLLPLSGKYQKLGENTKRGIELATSNVLKNNGYEVNFFDTKGDAFYSANLVQQIIDNQKVVMFLGPLLSDVSEKVGEVVEHSGIPMLTFAKNDHFATGYGMFRLGITPSSEISSLIDALYKYKHVRKFAIVYPENEKGKLYEYEFSELIKDWSNVEIVYEHPYYSETGNSFLTIASQLEKTGAEAVFMPDTLRSVSKLRYSLSPELKAKLLFVGTSSWDNQGELISSNAALDGIIFTSPFFDKDEKELVQKFTKVYQDKYREKPDFLSAQGFDAITMIFASIKRAIEESIAIEEAFTKIQSYVGLTGVIKVNSNGEINRNLCVVQWKNRTRQEITKSMEPSVTASSVFDK